MRKGRPRLQLDKDIIYKMATLHCTQKEIAKKMECDEETLKDNYSEVLNRGYSDGKTELRALQWASARKGNVEMLKWLGKEYLGQGKPQNIEIESIPIENLTQELAYQREAYLKEIN